MAALLGTLTAKDFDMGAAAMFGRLAQQFPARKSRFDRVIAAHALSLGLIVVTNNASDFAMYADAGLVVENWTV